jgi:uncharacterized membrane protein
VADTTLRLAQTVRGTSRSPVVPPPQPPGMSPVLERNIEALRARREREQAATTIQNRIAEIITRFAGSMTFVIIHLVVFGVWVGVNTGLIPGIPHWDDSFVVLGTSASVEAIFLSTFVLISQNRMAAAADQRADLDLQITLLAEHEVTKLMTLVAAIADKLEVRTEIDAEVEELKQDVDPEPVLDRLESEPAR